MKRKPGIPDTQGMHDSVSRVVDPIKENLEFLLGRSGGRIAALGPTATLPDCINKINEIVARLHDENV